MDPSTANTPRRPPAIRYTELAAGRLGASFRILDRHSGYLCEVVLAGRTLTLGAGSVNSWPINNAGAASLASDKGFTHLVLAERGIPTPRSEVVFLSSRFRAQRGPGREREDASHLADGLGWPVVAKPNSGSRGAYVQLCIDHDELQHHLLRMSERYDIGLMQSYVEGPEYRVLVFDGSPCFCYRKQRHHLLGDGVRDTESLIHEYSELLISQGLDPIDLKSSSLRTRLRDFDLGLDTIPAAGCAFDVGIRANLAAGGQPEQFTTDVPPHLAAPAVAAVAALGLRVGGVDLIEAQEDASVLEVNSNPTISSLEAVGRQDLAISLYERQLTQLFEEMV